MIDIHCHILPGVDDGSRSFDESIAMLQAAAGVGIDHIVCTPHCRSPWWNPAGIAAGYERLEPIARDMGIQMDLGYEVNWKKLYDLGIDVAPQLTLGESNMFLLEFSDESLPSQWQRLIYKLQSMGLQIIIAHPERYKAVQNDLDVAYEMKELGCYLQLSSNFLADGFFGKRRKTATALLRQGMVDYIASDAHCVEHYQDFAKALEYARKH